MRSSRLFIVALATISLLGFSSLANSDPENLAVCAACHGEDGSGAGFPYVPIIAGTPAAHLEEALFAYQDGARNCIGVPVMCEAVKSLTEEQIIEFAEYYSAMERISSDEEFDAQLAGVGKLIHDKQCGQCHVLPDAENVEAALGIPLNGQRSAYLRLALGAYYTGDRETLVPLMADELLELDPAKIQALVHYYSSYRQ